MKINNYSNYIKDEQLNEVMKLFSEDIRSSDIRIYILGKDDDFENISMSKDLQHKVNKFLENENAMGIFMYPENEIFIVEERILLFSDHPVVFYSNIPFMLSHELRHFRQAHFLGKRFNIMLSDYSLDYGEIFKNEEFDKLHWCEKDAYTYSYQFSEKYKQEIMQIFELDEYGYFLPFDFDIDYEKEWRKYKRKKMMVSEQIIWAVKDLFWEKELLKC
ncbi:hypothetical protein [Priestia megaterium]|uniref:hypothetical protein n=1 Tax=Priestia megaterium TaxID=1404 RepID=UPI0036706557